MSTLLKKAKDEEKTPGRASQNQSIPDTRSGRNLTSAEHAQIRWAGEDAIALGVQRLPDRDVSRRTQNLIYYLGDG
jgi:hypothetical protein